MRIIKDFKDEKERDAILKDMKDKATLIEEQYHFDGKHLVFEDGKPPRDLPKDFDDLVIKLKLNGVID